MRVVIPHQRRNAIALFEAGRLQRAAERQRAPVKITVTIAMQRLVGQTRHDFRYAEQLTRALEDMRERERVIHHCALHRQALSASNAAESSRSIAVIKLIGAALNRRAAANAWLPS